MIQENEIRVGNYFKYNEKHSEGLCMLNIPMKWDASDWYRVGECIDDLDWYNPIPLTEEILFKCGFKVSNTYWIELNGGTHHIDLHCINKEYYPILVQEPEMSSEEAQVINLHNIQYLHQLQNLYFALTGTELEVNL